MSEAVDEAILDLERWDRPLDDDDRTLLDRCVGPTIDLGCGPGRLAAALAGRGQVVLGIDLVGNAVRRTRRNGAAALCRDVFDVLPGEGRWGTVLLADGNVGIGGDPLALLHRVRRLIGPDGRVVVEVAPPGVDADRSWARVRYHGESSGPLRWAVLGLDHLDQVAASAGLLVGDVLELGRSWCAVLEAA